MQDKVQKPNQEWRESLSDEQYQVTREKGTEAPFTGKYNDCHDPGVYRCVCCGNELFDSSAKFESGTGWPSFTEPQCKSSIESTDDSSLGMRRTEVLCSVCDAHLGHVFDDGPSPSSKRYCINSAALDLDRTSKTED